MLLRKIVIYTRYSSDMQRADSCDDQVRNVRKALSRMGIHAGDAVVLKDEAQSGTKADRDQFELLKTMVERGEVAVLAVDDQSRLSRADNAYAFIQDLVYSGGRFISTGEGIDTQQKGWELRVKVTELHNSATIRNLAHLVRRGQEGRVLDDGSAGDFPFGYESFYLDAHWRDLLARRGPKPKKGLRINEEEAKWVRQVFHWFVVELWSIAAIARELTRLGVNKGNRATTKGWHHQQVRRMLANPKYVGQWPWGATTTMRNSSGKKKQVSTPVEQKIVRIRPELRIIEQETWDKAQQRLQDLEQKFGLQAGQKPRGPKAHPTTVYPQSLLGGLIYCGECASRLWLCGSGQRKHFACPNYRKGLCRMGTQVSISKAESSLIGFVENLLTSWPDWLQTAMSSLHQVLTEATNRIPEELEAKTRQLAKLEKEIANLVAALADGTLDSPAVKKRLADSEQQAESLRREITQARQVLATPAAIPDENWIKEQMTSLVSVLKEDTRRSATLLRQLLGKVRAHSILAPGKRRGYAQIRFQVNGWEVIRELLGNCLPDSLLNMMTAGANHASPEFHIDLGAPSRMDRLGATIAALREQGMKWKEICQTVGLTGGPAFVAWKRWIEAQKGNDPAA